MIVTQTIFVGSRNEFILATQVALVGLVVRRFFTFRIACKHLQKLTALGICQE